MGPKIQKFFCLGFLLWGTAIAHAAETTNFKTLEAWQSPRLYYFLKIADDLSSVGFVGAAPKSALSLPIKKMNEACKVPLRLQDLSLLVTPEQEILLSSDRSWLAVRVQEEASESRSSLKNIDLENRVSNSPLPCLLRIEWSSPSTGSLRLPLPHIVFSDAEHNFSGQRFRVREDFLVAALRYRIEASLGLRSIKVSDEAVSAATLGARGLFWINRLSYLGADFQILQSIHSFPKALTNSEWAFALSSRAHRSFWGLDFTLKPHLGLRQQLLLSEEAVDLSQNTRSISMLQAGVTLDVEFAERWLVRGRGEYGFKEFDRLSTSTSDWDYLLFDAALGYRLRPELRLLFEAGIHQYSRPSETIRKLDLVRCNIEMDF